MKGRTPRKPRSVGSQDLCLEQIDSGPCRGHRLCRREIYRPYRLTYWQAAGDSSQQEPKMRVSHDDMRPFERHSQRVNALPIGSRNRVHATDRMEGQR
jgi:hypothetical protein